MKKIYKSELEAMQDFWEELGITPDYSCNTDGMVDGLLFEMKLEVKSYADCTIQILKYIKAYNSTAMPIPSRAVLIDINLRKYNLYKINTDRMGRINLDLIKSDNWINPSEFRKFIDESLHKYCKGWINEYSFVAYNNRYCKVHINACKEQVKKEFINPCELNIYPFNWDEQEAIEKADRGDNNWLTFNMNMLGCSLLKKQLGAFFTPDKYVRISNGYLEEAIDKITSEGYEYIIIDTCAGTGNLQKFWRREWLVRTILNTYDYTEWTTLKGIYEGRVKMIVPHTSQYRNEQGLLLDGNALSEDFNNYLMDWLDENIDRSKVKIIMVENPPYRDCTADHKTRYTNKKNEITYIETMMKTQKINYNVRRNTVNQFIWKAFNVIRCDYYIVYSPIIYWKAQHLINKKFIKGYICNKQKFNANSATGVGLILWKNIEDMNGSIQLNNMDNEIKRIYKYPVELSYHSKDDDVIAYFQNSSVFCNGFNARLKNTKDKSHVTQYKIGKDNILNMLPLWVANCYIYKDYKETDVIMKSGDDGYEYMSDKEFLHKCFIWSCLSANSKCVSDDEVINQLCFSQGTIADEILDSISKDETDMKLLVAWNKLLIKAKEKEEYNRNYKYNLRQIEKDINILIETGRKKKNGDPVKVKKYNESGDVDDLVSQLKDQLKSYYDKHLTPKLFKYKLLV